MCLLEHLVVFLLFIVSTYELVTKKGSLPNLLLISFDGFRWNYLDRTNTPNFDVFLKNGVHSKYGLKNAFITKTFPNHYTLVTGLWEESHGIVANTFYDPHLNETFTLRNKDAQLSSRFFDNGGEPIWVTNQLQSSAHRSGVMMWPGGCASVKSVLPVKCVLYDHTMKNETRIDKVVEWFTSKYPINLGLLYFEEPDFFAHEYGPDSDLVTQIIGEIDSLVGYLLETLKTNNLLDDMNIIITSDHGFASTAPDQVIYLDKYINPNSYIMFTSNPIANILPHEGKEEEIYNNLTKASVENGHFKVYKREEIPDRFHYKHNDRVMPILIVPDEPYQLSHNGSKLDAGEHGWDNNNLDMHPFFLAMGPSFKQGASVDILDNVDIYPLMCHLLGLEPAPNNGTLQSSLPLMKSPLEHVDHSTVVTFGTYLDLKEVCPVPKMVDDKSHDYDGCHGYDKYDIGILILIASVGGVYIVAACRQHRYLKRQKRKMLRMGGMLGTMRFATPPNGAKVPLLSDTDEDIIIE